MRGICVRDLCAGFMCGFCVRGIYDQRVYVWDLCNLWNSWNSWLFYVRDVAEFVEFVCGTCVMSLVYFFVDFCVWIGG